MIKMEWNGMKWVTHVSSLLASMVTTTPQNPNTNCMKCTISNYTWQLLLQYMLLFL